MKPWQQASLRFAASVLLGIATVFEWLVDQGERIVMSIMQLVLRCFDACMASIPGLVRAEIVLASKERKNRERSTWANDARLDLSNEILLEAHKSDIDRLQRIEDKARGTVIGIAIAVGVASAGLGLLRSSHLIGLDGPLEVTRSVALFLAVLFFFASGGLALSAYKVSALFRLDLEDYVTQASGSGPADDKDLRITILTCIECNRIVATRKSNRLSASFACIRNGLIALVVFYVLAFGGLLGSEPQADKENRAAPVNETKSETQKK